MKKTDFSSLLRVFGVQSILTLSLFSGSASAGLINTNFSDTGDTTVDLVSGIGWLDVSVTRGLSVLDVETDLATDGGTLDPNGGWRYATTQDFSGLMNRWIDVDFVSGTLLLGSLDSILMDLFIETFGDTLDESYDANNSSLDAAEGGYGTTFGVLGTTIGTSDFRWVSSARDNNIVFRSGGAFAFNQEDAISLSSSLAPSARNDSFGHSL